MEVSSPVDHGKDGRKHDLGPLFALEIFPDHVQRSLRQGSGYHWDYDEIAGAQDLIGSIGQARRAVDDDPIIVDRQARRDFRQPTTFPKLMEKAVEMTERSIGRKNVQPNVKARPDKLQEVRIRDDACLHFASARLLSKDERRPTLRV
jgi:hypothetical protein